MSGLTRQARGSRGAMPRGSSGGIARGFRGGMPRGSSRGRARWLSSGLASERAGSLASLSSACSSSQYLDHGDGQQLEVKIIRSGNSEAAHAAMRVLVV